MPDNTTLNTNTTSGNVIRTLQDTDSVHWPAGVTCFATTVGTPDVLAVVQPTVGLPVRLADGSGYLSALPVTDNGGSLTVDGTVAVSGTVTVSGAVTNAGTFAVQVDGAALTSLQLLDNLVLAEDAAHASGDPGVQSLAVRKDTAAALAGTDGDYTPLISDSSGRLHVAVGNTVTVDGTGGTFPVTDSGGSLTVDNAALSVTGGGVEASALRVTIASDSTGVLSVDDNGGSLTVDGTVAATQSGTWNVGTVTTVTTVSTVSTLTGGGVAHDAADSGNPVKVGARATNVNIAAVANDDRSDLVTDLTGKLVVSPYSVPEVSVDGTNSATDTSNTSVIAAQGAGVRIYVTTLVLANSSSTNITVAIKSATTTRMTVPVPANGGVVVPLPKPLRLAANEALQFAASTGVTTAYCSAVGYAAP